MLGVAQYRNTFYYLNWVPSESGPLVTHFGSHESKPDKEDSPLNPFTSVFQDLFSKVNNGEPICTLSLDINDLYLSACSRSEDSEDLFHWHLKQSQDDLIKDFLDFYHFPLASSTNKMLNIAIPKQLRQFVQDCMAEINGEMNVLGAGIFSAEEGARQWFHADQLKSYLVWKFGRMKNDELLLIEEGQLTACFSINRSGNKVKLNWNFGKIQNANEISHEISNILNGQSEPFKSVEKVFIYCGEGNFKDVKSLHERKIKNITLLNPLSVLETTVKEKFHPYKTLPLAETGISFRGIDV